MGREPVPGASYDRLGRGYAGIRRPDSRLAAQILAALADSQSIVNVGAGTGSYEPNDRRVIAIEPSRVMVSQRPPSAPPAIQAVAESLPLRDRSVDAALAVLTVQHWTDVERGVGEMLRVARRRVVLLTMDADVASDHWLVRDYFPEARAVHVDGFPSMTWLLGRLPRARSIPLAVPIDCTDGFAAAYWGRPEAYLDPEVRAASSVWHQMPEAVVTRGIARLRADLDSGEWDRRHGDLRGKDSLDVGLRLVSADLS